MTFPHPFKPDSSDHVLPAGTYVVSIDEEMIDGISRPVFRRTATTLYTPSITAGGGARQALPTTEAEIGSMSASFA